MLETGTEERPERLAAATACGANEGLELREAELDGIEVRAVGWQVPEGGPGGLDGALDAGDLVGPEVVGDDDVAGLQGRHQDLFDVGAEALAIDRAVEDTRCGQPRDPVSIVKTAGGRAPAHQARGRGRRTWRPTERTAGARMVPPGEGNEARGDGRRGSRSVS